MPRPTKPQALPEGLEIWTVYENPSDFPGKFVARLFINDKPTSLIMVTDELKVIRRRLQNKGFVRLPRATTDDPVIVECWL
jgi:hypothetical protein